jgi:hypothetical protein
MDSGLRWLCADRPRDIGFLQRLLRKFSNRKQVVEQNDALHGWGWTPNTASWVEPTAFALLALEQASSDLGTSDFAKRRTVGKALLRDRMCPGGGWNCGNPMVYGVPGDPLVEPTVWALLALRDEPDRPENKASLEWLEKNLTQIAGARSLALSKICWETYGRKWPANAPTFREIHSKNEFLGSVLAAAWTCLALGQPPKWIRKLNSEQVR